MEGTSARRGQAPEGSVPDALAPPPGHPRFPLFDSLRAIAALAVLLFHTTTFSITPDAWYAGLAAHLDVGVTLFFVISGFLLYRPFVASRILGAPSTAIRDYGRRRLLRIAPAYWLALTALAIFPGVYGAFSGNWWVYYGLLQNYPIYTVSGGCLTEPLKCGIEPTWSLAVEVSFYVALPFFALAVGRLSTRARGGGWFGVQLAALAVLAVVSVLTADRLGTDLEQVLFLSPIGFGLWFGLGMAMALLSVRVQQRGAAPDAVRWIGERPLVPWTVAVIIYLVLSLVVLEPISGGQIPHSEIRFVGFGLIAALIALPAVFSEPRAGLPTRVLANPVLGWLGLVSYGIFLWHWPIALALVDGGVLSWWPHLPVLVLTALTLAITLVCAAVSYYLVERPLMRLKYRRGSLPAAPEGRPATG